MDYYWSREWDDWSDFDSDDERAIESERRLERRRVAFPISKPPVLPPYVPSEKQRTWEMEQCKKSNARVRY